MLRKLESILRRSGILMSSFLLSHFFSISLSQNLPSTSEGMLRSLRRVSLLNRGLGRLHILVLISLHPSPLYIYIGMPSRFSKAKLTEIREKKAKVGLTSGLLTRKCQ